MWWLHQLREYLQTEPRGDRAPTLHLVSMKVNIIINIQNDADDVDANNKNKARASAFVISFKQTEKI